MSKLIVFGGSGQLGQCLKVVSAKTGTNLVFPDKSFSDILDMHSLEKLFERERPQYVINCAAYTAVDKAEEEIDSARNVNKEGAMNLARLCKKHDSILIHISTDFVFEGNKPVPLTEEDLTAPINVYGVTKLEGELAIADVLDKYFILRTSWLYSEFGNNFVKTMLRLGQDRSELNVICDQIGTPTYAIDLAECILHIIQTNESQFGLYHFSNEGVASWYDFAASVFSLSGLSTKVNPILSKDYLTKAKRPSFSVMDKSKIKKLMQLEIPHWRDSLQNCIENLKNDLNNIP